jgi:hypothetical protein
MKFLSYTFLAAVAASGLAVGQSAVKTKPVGYNTSELKQGLNAVGLTLHNNAVATGALDLESGFGNTVTDDELAISPIAGRIYILEIVTGQLAGSIQEIEASAISGTTITTPDNLETMGLLDGDLYRLRLAPTLEEVFTTTPLASGGVLIAALNSTNADIVWVSAGPGVFDKYYLHTSKVFRNVATNAAAPNVSLIYPDGLFVQKKTPAQAELVVAGEVKEVGTNSVIGQGLNLVSVVAPVGMTLRTAGLEDSLTAALNTTNADIVWVQNSTLGYDKYFRHSASGGTWRSVDAPTVVLDPAIDPPLAGAIYIQKKKAGSTNLSIAVPESYENL